MLSSLGQYQDLSIFELTPLALDLPRLEIPLGRPGKRAHEFMSLRESLVDN